MFHIVLFGGMGRCGVHLLIVIPSKLFLTLFGFSIFLVHCKSTTGICVLVGYFLEGWVDLTFNEFLSST